MSNYINPKSLHSDSFLLSIHNSCNLTKSYYGVPFVRYSLYFRVEKTYHVSDGSRVLEKKWRHFVSTLDYDKKGTVSLQDHEAMAERSIKTAGLDPKSIQAAQMRDKLNKSFFNINSGLADGKPATYDTIVNTYENNQNELRRYVNMNAYSFFDLIDLNGDGLIQLEEFRKFYYMCGIKESEADMVFKMIDLNGKGILERQEFAMFLYDFFFSTDPNSPSKHFFGIFNE